MGLFDIPAPLFDWIDTLAARLLPAWSRLLLWGGIAAWVSMLLYRRLSAQEGIRRGKRELRRARQRLNDFRGELGQAWPLMHDLLKEALHQVGRTGWPAVVASLPLLFLLNWMSTAYGYTFPPPGIPMQVQTVPGRFRAEWVEPDGINMRSSPNISQYRPEDGPYPRIVIFNDHNRVILDTRIKAPVPVIHKRRWWNTLIGNPVGYLPRDAPVERVRAGLPRRQHLSFGPDWMRSWEFTFFASLLAVSVGLKKKLKIA